MKIISWNVNGLRAIAKKGSFNNLLDLKADIYLLQEIKSEENQLTDDIKSPNGYFGYFNSSKTKKGYSGTALYSKTKPDQVIYGFPSYPDFDMHGRVITGIFGKTAVVNAYFPNGNSETSNLKFKLEFYDLFLQHLKDLSVSYETILAFGDYNVAHTEIDLARPKENMKNVGFLPEERQKLDYYHQNGFIDIWRHFNPELKDVYTYWDQKTGARARNVGWRIDYCFINNKSLEKIKNIEILTDFLGSDHCPVSLETKN